MNKRMSRLERKEEILRVLRVACDEGRGPLTCRGIAREMDMTGYSYINGLLAEMSDDDMVRVHVIPSKKKISNVIFKYEV